MSLKMMDFKHKILAMALLLFLWSCGTENRSENVASAETGQENTATTGGSQQEIKIIAQDNVAIATITIGEAVNISLGNDFIYSKIGSSGKRKYIGGSETTLAKINRYDYGFKLKTLEGAVLWKVKNEEGHIKIANNDAMENAFKIKKKSKTKIYKNEEEVGHAKKSDAFITVQGSAGSQLKVVSENELIAAVIGIEEIPIAERLIILAELLQ